MSIVSVDLGAGEGASIVPADPGTGARATIALVIDTNIWLDMLVFDDAATHRLASLLQPSSVPRLRPLASDAMRAELADVITRPLFKLDAAAQAALLARFDHVVSRAPAALDCRLPCRDPDDCKFLDLAVGRRTPWLLSRDRALLAVRKLAWRRFELRIGQVADFYAWLDQSGCPRLGP
jgi:putative PIN family toxin of toxin-antitoxin system